jgi:hypothetical protein
MFLSSSSTNHTLLYSNSTVQNLPQGLGRIDSVPIPVIREIKHIGYRVPTYTWGIKNKQSMARK